MDAPISYSPGYTPSVRCVVIACVDGRMRRGARARFRLALPLPACLRALCHGLSGHRTSPSPRHLGPSCGEITSAFLLEISIFHFRSSADRTRLRRLTRADRCPRAVVVLSITVVRLAKRSALHTLNGGLLFGSPCILRASCSRDASTVTASCIGPELGAKLSQRISEDYTTLGKSIQCAHARMLLPHNDVPGSATQVLTESIGYETSVADTGAGPASEQSPKSARPGFHSAIASTIIAEASKELNHSAYCDIGRPWQGHISVRRALRGKRSTKNGQAFQGLVRS